MYLLSPRGNFICNSSTYLQKKKSDLARTKGCYCGLIDPVYVNWRLLFLVCHPFVSCVDFPGLHWHPDCFFLKVLCLRKYVRMLLDCRQVPPPPYASFRPIWPEQNQWYYYYTPTEYFSFWTHQKHSECLETGQFTAVFQLLDMATVHGHIGPANNFFFWKNSEDPQHDGYNNVKDTFVKIYQLFMVFVFIFLPLFCSMIAVI